MISFYCGEQRLASQFKFIKYRNDMDILYESDKHGWHWSSVIYEPAQNDWHQMSDDPKISVIYYSTMFRRLSHWVILKNDLEVRGLTLHWTFASQACCVCRPLSLPLCCLCASNLWIDVFCTCAYLPVEACLIFFAHSEFLIFLWIHRISSTTDVFTSEYRIKFIWSIVQIFNFYISVKLYVHFK